MIKFRLLAVLILILPLTSKSIENKVKISVTFDSRVELIGILCYLSDYPEYSITASSYKSAVDEYFKDFKNHEAIAYLKEIRTSNSIAYDAPMHIAVYLNDSLNSTVPFDDLPKDFDKRWNKESLDKFIKLIKKFAADTRFNDFFQMQKKKYENSIFEIEQKINSSINFDWFNSYFGEIPENIKFNVLVSLTTGSGNYGTKTKINNIETDYSIISVCQRRDKLFLHLGTIPVIIHEFCHSYCNPIIDEYESTLVNSGKLLYNDYISRKHIEAYSYWKIVLQETLVRTSVLCYLKSNGNFITFNLNYLIIDKNQGFLWTKQLAKSFYKLNKKTKLNQSKDLYIDTFIKDLNSYLNKIKTKNSA